MALLDTLKNIANNFFEKHTKGNNEEKAASDDIVTDFKRFGSIKGDWIPDYEFTIQDDKLLMCEKEGDLYKLRGEFSLDDIVEFRHNYIDKINKGVKGTGYINTLVLSSGRTLDIYMYIFFPNNPSPYLLKMVYEDWCRINLTIVHFIDKVKDAKTKEWINNFYLSEIGEAPFDENGEIDLARYFEIARKALGKKSDEIENEIKAL